MEAVDLRPLSLGELLDRTFRLYRNHFLLFVSIMAIPAAFLLPFNMAILSFQGSIMSSAATSPGKPPVLPTAGMMGGLFLGAGLFFIVFILVYALAVAAASTAVSDVYLGRATSMRGAFARIRGKFWRLIGVVVNITLRALGVMIAVFVVFGGGMGALGALGESARNPMLMGILALGLVFGYLAGLVFCVYFWLRYAVAVPVLMIENAKVLPTIRRSVYLTQGRRGQIFLAMLVAGLVAYAGAFVFQMPFTIAMLVSAVQGHWSQWLAFATAVSGAIGSALTGPISMIAIVLLYYDSRIRKEAFDLQFMMNALDAPPAAPTGTSSPATPA